MEKQKDVAEFERRLRVLLPATYQVFDDDVRPSSMGSAGLKFGPDGKVLWDAIWRSFCDLSMAGGPPHRGTLLAAARLTADDAASAAYSDVVGEICRGLSLVTGLCAESSPLPGWVRLYCRSAAMTGWLMRAIVMENVTAVGAGLTLYLPAGPNFRVEKEVKNVITSVAKTCHYWLEHMEEPQHDEVAALLREMEGQSPLVMPPLERSADSQTLAALAKSVAATIRAATGLESAVHDSPEWLGVDCRHLEPAVWMMRALATANCLPRREGTIVFLPLNAQTDPDGAQTSGAIIRAHSLAQQYGIFGA